MKVFSLQARIYRGAWLSSRLTAQTSQLAAVRRDALERWRRARSRGLSAEEAARAVGASRASLYRWEKRLEPRSRRPHRQRQPTWTSALMRKIERLRADHPMWGKRKLAVLLRREGIAVSVSVGSRGSLYQYVAQEDVTALLRIVRPNFGGPGPTGAPMSPGTRVLQWFREILNRQSLHVSELVIKPIEQTQAPGLELSIRS